jgi:hypothetical protein
VEQFWDATPRELINAYRGRYREQERLDRERWEQMRWSTAALLQPHAKQGQRIKPAEILPFPWEKKRGGLSKAERLERLKKL